MPYCIFRLLVNMAVPMIMSMLVQALYNVVDSIYISRYSESAVTALGLAFPIQNVQIGFAVGIGVGVNSLLSKSLGEGNQDRADCTAGNGIFLALVATAIFVLFGLFGVRPYYQMPGASQQIVESGIPYRRAGQFACNLLLFPTDLPQKNQTNVLRLPLKSKMRSCVLLFGRISFIVDKKEGVFYDNAIQAQSRSAYSGGLI